MERSLYDFTLPDLDGKDVPLRRFEGKVLLLVNVASKCGFTPQYAGLQALYERYRECGFEVLGFPANDFLFQEPGGSEQIKSFCTLTYGVSFPMFAKISVRGRKIHPLYRFLTDKSTNPRFSGRLTWNFNKFLVDRQGSVVDRFDSREEPLAARLTDAVERELRRQPGA